jgi:hypothetical protein
MFLKALSGPPAFAGVTVIVAVIDFEIDSPSPLRGEGKGEGV